MKNLVQIDSINSKLSSSIVTKVVVIIVFLIAIFSFIMFFYIDVSIKNTLKDISSEQMNYIEFQIQKNERENIEREIRFIKLYIRSVKSAIENALSNFDKESLKEILKNFMNIRSIQEIKIYDNLSKKIILDAKKKKGSKIIFFDKDMSGANEKLNYFKYDFKKCCGKSMGYMKVYYDIRYIKEELKNDTKIEIARIKNNFKKRVESLKYKQKVILFILAGYIILIIFTIIVILEEYIKLPLEILYTNLHSFFKFLEKPAYECKLIPLEGKDEFGIISSKLNDSMKRAIKLHKKLSYFIDVLDKHVLYAQYDRNGDYLKVSEAFCRLSGYNKEELLKKNHFDTLADKDELGMYEKIKKECDLKEHKIVSKHMKKDGTIYYLSSTVTPKVDKNSQVYKYTEIMHDVTYEKELMYMKKEIENTQKEIIYTIGTISEERSHETGDHIKRVTSYVELLAKHLGFSKDEVKLIKIASAMHDVGKIAIPDHILNKPRKLTDEEFEIMKKHTIVGYDMLKHSKRDLLKAAAIIALTHHEKYDGSGYPNGLKGEEIHIYGRIVTLADVFDALGTKRVYKDAWDDERIFEYILNQKGKHFDPKLVEIFFKHKEEFLKIKREFCDRV